jgi:hypothetical protein
MACQMELKKNDRGHLIGPGTGREWKFLEEVRPFSRSNDARPQTRGNGPLKGKGGGVRVSVVV